MNRTIVFDMDGTIADFYGVENWLIEIRNESTKPYEIAEPLYNIETLNTILEFLKMSGWRIVVTSWLAKDSTKEYKEKVRKAKLEWLKKYDFPFDEIHLVQYGTTKANCTRHLGGFQVLVDDNEKVRKGWTLGDTINANENILEKLINLA
jgi:FMN phosphatase YigB (HAD superfamily)